jgi:uncharacterized protein (TIGR00730 family)
MTKSTALCVYCGSAGDVDSRYRQSAIDLGQAMAARGVTLVYGGGRIGLMGLLAEACHEAGGNVVGIIPEFLERAEIGEVEESVIGELMVVGTMHERKQLMADLSDGFVVLPGGFGTLDEFFEILTWRQLGLHDKPIFLLDCAGYWEPLTALLEHLLEQKFARPSTRRLWDKTDTVAGLFAALDALPEVQGPSLTALG